jgi:hypothetical protein
MNNKTQHKILCKSPDFATAKQHVIRYFEQTMLLNYDSVEIDASISYPASSESFWPDADAAILKNRKLLASYIAELHHSGCQDFNDIKDITVGYQSKLIHLIAHLVDGFIGIDSLFFCLPEDSHWVSDPLKETIQQNPEQFWLLHVNANFHSIESAALVRHP